MRVYFDSSAFAKRYVVEAGTAEVLAWCDRATELAFSVIAVPELVSAFRRLRREGRLTEAQYLQLKGDLMADIVDAESRIDRGICPTPWVLPDTCSRT